MILEALVLAMSTAITVQPEQAALTDDDVVLAAKQIFRESTDGDFIAEGDVRARSGDQFLRADKVIYNQQTDEVTAIGNVAVRDESGQLYFADEVVLTSDLKNGVIEAFAAEFQPRGNLAAATVLQRESGINELRRGVYTLCDVCDEGFRAGRPSWQVKADKVVQNEDEQRLRFYNALIELYGVPVMYLPFLQIPDPSAKRASGFLAPQGSSSTRTGVEIEIPYYFAISDYQDLTFAPRHFGELGTLIKGQYRRNTYNSRLNLQAGIIDPTNDLTDEPGNPEDIRWHFFSKYERDLPGNWGLAADIDGVSDKAYLLTYDIEPEGELEEEIGILRPDRLESNLSITRETDNATTDVTGLLFQTLRFNEDQGFTAQALPRVTHEQRYDMFGGEVSVGGSFLTLLREEGLDSFRLSGEMEYSAVKLTRNGHRFETFAELRADQYSYANAQNGIQACNVNDSFFETCREDLPRDLDSDSYNFSRVLPTVGAEWSYPLVRVGENTTFIIEPRVQAVLAPNRDDTGSVFNEDSQFFQFDTVNLFDFNKGPGLDVWEDGQRLNLGVSTTAAIGTGLTVNGMLGAQLRAEETDVFGQDSGIGGKQSDYVGAVEFQVGSNLIFDNRFRVDSDTGSFRRVETSLLGKAGPLTGLINYLRVENDEFAENQILDEFLTVSGTLQVTRGITIAATQNQNLDSGNTANTTVAIRFANECLALSIRFRFDDSTVEGFEQDTRVSFRLDLLGFQ